MRNYVENSNIKKVEGRIRAAQIAILLFFAVSVIYLFLLQIVDIRHYKARANS